jgi:hypothetical protein
MECNLRSNVRVAGSMQQFVFVAGVAETCHVTLRHYRTTPSGTQEWAHCFGWVGMWIADRSDVTDKRRDGWVEPLLLLT